MAGSVFARPSTPRRRHERIWRRITPGGDHSRFRAPLAALALDRDDIEHLAPAHTRRGALDVD